MPRLIDKLISHPIFSGKVEFNPLFDVISTAECVAVDNVARYFWELSDKSSVMNFPNIAPVFENVFYEAHLPSQIVTDNLRKYPSNDTFAMIGISAISAPVESFVDDINHFLRFDTTMPNAMRGSLQEALKNITCTDDAKWVTCFRAFYEKGNGHIAMEQHYWMVPITSTGNWSRFNTIFSSDDLPEDASEVMLGNFAKYVSPVLLAISFMHCKNVTMEQVVPPAPFSKKHQKKHGRPLEKYHVLNIEPMKKVLRTEGQSEKTGLRQALHICRGHFKDFSKGTGLFGKYKGLYWWDSQVRGSHTEGIVDKDYNVKSPRKS